MHHFPTGICIFFSSSPHLVWCWNQSSLCLTGHWEGLFLREHVTAALQLLHIIIWFQFLRIHVPSWYNTLKYFRSLLNSSVYSCDLGKDFYWNTHFFSEMLKKSAMFESTRIWNLILKQLVQCNQVSLSSAKWDK